MYTKIQMFVGFCICS